jgi:hypothetical protein
MDKVDKTIKAIRAYVRLLVLLVGIETARNLVASIMETLEDVS